jgi:hypothetical protein
LTGDAGRGCGDASRALLFVENTENTTSCAARPSLVRPQLANIPQQQKIRHAVKRTGFF